MDIEPTTVTGVDDPDGFAPTDGSEPVIAIEIEPTTAMGVDDPDRLLTTDAPVWPEAPAPAIAMDWPAVEAIALTDATAVLARGRYDRGMSDEVLALQLLDTLSLTIRASGLMRTEIDAGVAP